MFGDNLAVDVHQARDGRNVVGLRDVDEVLSIGRDIDAMGEGRVGQALVARTVQPHAVKLDLHVVVAGARRVPEPAGLLVDLGDLDDVEPVVGEPRELLAGEIVEIEIAEVVALGDPDEALAVLEEARRRA